MEITKAKKGSDQYLMDWCDYVIGDLVKEKELKDRMLIRSRHYHLNIYGNNEGEERI